MVLELPDIAAWLSKLSPDTKFVAGSPGDCAVAVYARQFTEAPSSVRSFHLRTLHNYPTYTNHRLAEHSAEVSIFVNLLDKKYFGGQFTAAQALETAYEVMKSRDLVLAIEKTISAAMLEAAR